jgi:hypothetical protein
MLLQPFATHHMMDIILTYPLSPALIEEHSAMSISREAFPAARTAS